ncbi:hypothetical protein [Ponticaulis sp.]|uniref:hypothetical protein n=1 Tax=Ponticaulis sp. TaxID=2020902 RepID=UPI000C4F6DCE|nr:hypothetical protein [Ponticaulis sp.]MAJ10573.1 hypothetical protein [Ponticaulis sp.]HBH90275.1 hypothetical protein [Hyphomonadaceae bacterium]HBJ94208.1 hypothetical protein [Hyphomonadaceae bacterium]|tara:strand:- start:8891 stop:10093 length:1203 start_codon:yes stop_codon:yes gene_type:complete
MRSTGTIAFSVLILLVGGAAGFGVSRLVPDTASDAPQTPAVSQTSAGDLNGMRMLEDLQCVRGEYKRIVVRGEEDGFSSSGDEAITRSPLHDFMENRFGRRGAVGIDRSYDDGRLDQVLLDSLVLPSNVANGVIALGIRERSLPRNDTITIGDLFTKTQLGHAHVETFSRIGVEDTSPWQQDGNLIFARLRDLTFAEGVNQEGQAVPADYSNLLDWIRGAQNWRSIEYAISEDTMVDFVGVAVCLEPDTSSGTTFLATPIPNTDEIVRLGCSDPQGNSLCNPYVGDTQCSTELPLACLHEEFRSAPEGLVAENLQGAWTGASISFTEPVAGDLIDTQSDGHALCQASFGADWRMVNIHDGLMIDEILGMGSLAAPTSVWVDSQNQRYGNCWKLDDAGGAR